MRLRQIVAALAATSVTSAAGCAHANLHAGSAPSTRIAPSVETSGMDSVAAAKALKSGCAGASNRSDCYQAALVPVAAAGSVRLAMGTLDELGKIDVDVRREGHVLAHAIGIAAGKGGRNIASSFTQCSETFQSGCYHGIIQAYFASLDSIGPAETNALCDPFRKNTADRWIRFQCVHGMGHGLTMLYNHDLPRGLAGCDLLLDGWDRRSCYGGAFMENIVNVTMPHHPASELAHHGTAKSGTASDIMDGMRGMDDMPGMTGSAPAFKPVDPGDPLYPCSILPDRYAPACYEMQTSVILYENHGNIAGAAKTCDTAPSAIRTICYISLGRDISSYSAQNHAEAIRMCGLGSEKYQPWCYYGLVKNLIDLNARPADGLAMCRDVSARGNKAECYSAAGEEIWLLAATPEERARLCSTSEPDYLDACLFGAQVKTTAPPVLLEVWRSIKAAAQ